MNSPRKFPIRRCTPLVAAAALLAACGGGGGGSGGNPPAPPAPPPVPAPPAPPPADTTPPETTISAAPATTIYTNSASITFTSDEAGATFEGRLDGAEFAAVTSPVTLASLADGTYTYEVRARDVAGNIDASPAAAQWTVLAGPPDTSLDSNPGAATTAGTATFEFSSNKPGSTFEVSVDGGAFAASPSPFELTGLATGTHSFAVRAIDADGQADATPAIHQWAVDVTAPTARILFPLPLSYTEASVLTVRGTATDAHGIDSVSVNGVAATSIDGYANWRANLPLSAINTTITVSVTDLAGNTTASADSASITNRGPQLVGYVGVAFDSNGNQLVAVDRYADRVYGYDATTGVGRLISEGPAPGALPNQFSPTVLQVDATRNRALYIDYQIDALVAVDLATGTRSIASPSQGANHPTSMVVANDLALDPANNRAFAYNMMCNCIIAMDLDTATRSIISSASVGGGDPFPTSLLGLVYDNVTTPGTPRLLSNSFVGFGVHDIVAIDVATGNRSTLSSANLAIGTGPSLEGTMSIMLDPVRKRLLTADNNIFGIMAVDLATGNRSQLMDQNAGTGPMMYPTIGAAYDPDTNRMFSQQVLDDELIVTDLDTLARTNFISPDVGSGPEPIMADALVLEQSNGSPTSLVYTQMWPPAVARLDLVTGERTIISDASTGSGPVLDGIADLILDTRASAGPNKALVLLGSPNFRLLSVDLVTGDRVQVANLNSAAPAVADPRSVQLDAANNRVLFTDADMADDADALYAIDLATGVRTTLSSDSVGSGLPVGQFTAFIFDSSTSPARVLLSDADQQSIVDVNLATGQRTLFANFMNSGGTGQFNRPGLLYHDVANERLIGMNAGTPPNMFSLSLSSLTQSLISGLALINREPKGAGPQFIAPMGMAVDPSRQVIFVTDPASGSLLAVDLVSGDRVIIAN